MDDMHRAFRSAADDALGKVLESRTFESFEESYQDWVHTRNVLRAYEDALKTLEEDVAVNYKGAEEKPREGILKRLRRWHRMTENITLEVGEYMGLWGPKEECKGVR